MRQQIAKVSGASLSSNVLVMDTYITPFNVGFGVVITGTVAYYVQHTFDNPQTVASPQWFYHPSTPSSGTGAIANLDGNYAFPVAAIKILTTSATNTGTITLTVIQAGNVQ
jgi:hypothetical protein